MTKRVTCPRCGVTVQATQTGSVRTHGPLTKRCSASGKMLVDTQATTGAKKPTKTTVKKVTRRK